MRSYTDCELTRIQLVLALTVSSQHDKTLNHFKEADP